MDAEPRGKSRNSSSRKKRRSQQDFPVTGEVAKLGKPITPEEQVEVLGKVDRRIKYTPEVKAKVVALAETTSLTHASKVTGINTTTIFRWMKRAQKGELAKIEGIPGEPRSPKRVRAIAVDAAEEAKERVTQILVDRILNLANNLYIQAENATEKIRVARLRLQILKERRSGLQSVLKSVSQF